MPINDYNKIRSQQDLRKFLDELDNAVQAIIMNDGIYTNSTLYCSLKLCQDALYYAKNSCRDFVVERNSFKDE